MATSLPPLLTASHRGHTEKLWWGPKFVLEGGATSARASRPKTSVFRHARGRRPARGPAACSRGAQAQNWGGPVIFSLKLEPPRTGGAARAHGRLPASPGMRRCEKKRQRYEVDKTEGETATNGHIGNHVLRRSGTSGLATHLVMAIFDDGAGSAQARQAGVGSGLCAIMRGYVNACSLMARTTP